MTAGWPTRSTASIELEDVDVGGIGGTLAGNALSLAAMRATLERGADRGGVRAHDPARRALRRPASTRRSPSTALPWHVTRLGCRAEYRFGPEPPRNGAEAAAAATPTLERYMHLYTLNRGILHDPVPQHGADVPGARPRPTSTATPRCSATPYARS